MTTIRDESGLAIGEFREPHPIECEAGAIPTDAPSEFKTAVAMTKLKTYPEQSEPKWKPIKSAPMDGTQILAHDAEGALAVIFWGKHNHVPLYGWLRQVELYGEEVDAFDPVEWTDIPPFNITNETECK